MFFKENLVYLRKSYNLTQDSLAEQINVKRYNISDWEQGRSEPSLERLVSLCAFCDVNIDLMLGQKIEPFKKEDFAYCISIIKKPVLFA